MKPELSLHAHARRLNGRIGISTRHFEDVLIEEGRRLAFRLQKEWKIRWTGTTGERFKITDPMDLPPEMLAWGIGLVAIGWASDIYLRKARDRKSSKMRKLYQRLKRLVREGMRDIEAKVSAYSGKSKQRDWQRYARKCKASPRFNPKKNRIEGKGK